MKHQVSGFVEFVELSRRLPDRKSQGDEKMTNSNSCVLYVCLYVHVLVSGKDGKDRSNCV